MAFCASAVKDDCGADRTSSLTGDSVSEAWLTAGEDSGGGIFRSLFLEACLPMFAPPVAPFADDPRRTSLDGQLNSSCS